MILGLHNMLDALSQSWNAHMSSEGAWWILALNAIFLIPLIFAVFFYPMEIGIGVGTVVLIALGLAGLVRLAHTHRRRVGHH